MNVCGLRLFLLLSGCNSNKLNVVALVSAPHVVHWKISFSIDIIDVAKPNNVFPIADRVCRSPALQNSSQVAYLSQQFRPTLKAIFF